MRNFIFGFLAAAMVGALMVAAFSVGRNQEMKKMAETTVISETPVASPTAQLVGNDRDEHGCIGSAGYTWCAAKNKCLRVWEEPCEGAGASDSAAIKTALVQKHNWDPTQIEVTVSHNDGHYASGGVKETGAISGGYFFAVNDQGTWKIIADGNGTIECTSLTSYPDYPTSLIPECYNSTTGQVVKR
ncbi:hypothetical protein M1523_02490 [Patescibacteria group bacterium]|nr:hypothetical protein [Patescibacteria group bacterium]MCL5091410.1 hypothetical protein [Patescibacteria group bacterium]